MKIYARIQDGRVAELMTTTADIKSAFHPSLLWIDVSSLEGLSVGWSYNAGHFRRPEVTSPASEQPSLAELRAQVALLTQKITALDQPA